MAHVYRGTSLSRAVDEEFATGAVRGRTFDIVSGFMDPEDAEEEWSGEYVTDLPWEEGPKYQEKAVTGGFSERLGAAQAFSAGGIPLVFHLDRSRVRNLTGVSYSYDFFDAVKGAAPWVDGSASGEIRVNGDLEGLLTSDPNEPDTPSAIKYYGQSLRDRAMRYEDEMEQVQAGTDSVDIDRATEGVVAYVRRPVSNLSALEGYSRVESRYAEERGDEIVGDYSDEEAIETIAEEAQAEAPGWADVWVVQVERYLVTASWGYEEGRGDIVSVYGPGGWVDTGSEPEWIRGDF